MNYIAELKAFYDRLELNPLPSPAIALWHALMSIANKTGWQQEFTAAVSLLMLKSGLNAQAIKRARNRLEQDGYITWRSRGGNQSAVYHINSLVVQNDIKNVPQYEPQTVPQTDLQSVPQYEPQTVPINKHKQNETDMYDNACTRFEDFWFEYPKQSARMLTEQAYVQLVVSGISESDLITAAKNYAESCRIKKTSSNFISNANNWLNNSKWVDYTAENYKKPSGTGKFNNFNQRQYDYDALEQQLLGGGAAHGK